MSRTNYRGQQEFSPEDAFMIALDDAIAATAQSLHDAGVDEHTIWQAFRKAISAVNDATADIDAEGLLNASAGVFEAQVA